MKVKSILAALLLTVAGLQTVSAQGFRVYKTDGTVAQFSLRTDSIVFYDGIGTDVDFGPFTPVNQMVVGTWYRTQTETVTFNEDGTTDYIEGATYKFQPYQGSIIIYNAAGIPINIFRVHAMAAGTMVVSTLDGSFRVWGNTPQPQPVTSISLSDTSITLNTSETKTLTATLPEDAANKEVTWKSSNESVATVDQTGKVTAVAKGSCTIIVTAADGSGTKAECAVTVVQLVTGITLSETSLTLTTGTTQTLTASIQPTNANNKKVTWKSSDESVATIDQTGKVTAVAKGSCTITATAADGSGVKAECAVTVIQLVTGITLDSTSMTLPTGTTQTLTASIQPTNANNKKVTWKSNDESVATVDQTGKVTAVAKGSCTITATAADGSGVKAECEVTVIQLVTSIKLSENSLTLYAGLTETLTPTVEPADANNMTVTWESSDESVATVDQTGTVTAVALGICTITCRATDDSGEFAECQVTVDHEWVDLGLPSGTLWATYNVGANNPKEYGEYFAWGETEPKENYSWSTYKHCNGSENTLTKYCTDSNYGTVDNKTELEPEDDAATVNWGSGWQIPSIEQCVELVDENYTTTEWTKLNDVNGRLIISKVNGNSIFLPAAGYRVNTSSSNTASYGDYWSRSLDTSVSYYTRYFYFSNGGILINANERFYGRTVRPVRKQ